MPVGTSGAAVMHSRLPRSAFMMAVGWSGGKRPGRPARPCRRIRDLSGETQVRLRRSWQRGELQEGGASMQTTPWVVVECDDKQTIQREFSQGEIVDQFPAKEHPIFLVQS